MSREYSTEELLRASYKDLPVLLFAKDEECRYVFASTPDYLVFRNEEKSIIGRTDLDIGYEGRMGQMYYEQDRHILATGETVRCVSEFLDEDRRVYREVSKSAIYDDDGNIMGISGIVSDVTELVELRQKFQQLSLFDALTGVYNRNYVVEYDFNSEDYLPCGYILCDCDSLKQVNDSMGHEEGDRYIQEMCKAISAAVEDNGIVIRWGGDEFLIIAPGYDETACRKLVERIDREQEALKAHMPYAGCARGWMVRSSMDETENEIIKMADSRMYQNKQVRKAE